jgi:hypothetical protein
MKPTIICDIDCTLYSYREFVKKNMFHPVDTFGALFNFPEAGEHFPGIHRTWMHFEAQISDRIRLIHEKLAPLGEVFFLSAFPAESYKKATFEKLGLRMASSYPERKVKFLRAFQDKKIVLVIGDRTADKDIAATFFAPIVYIPFYKSLQQESGEAYTDRLLKQVSEVLKN